MLKDMAAQIAEVVKKSVVAATDSLYAKLDPRITALEKDIAVAHTMASEVREAKEAVDAWEEKTKEAIKEVLENSVEPLIKVQVAAIPPAKDGEDGKSVTLDDVIPIIRAAVDERVAQLPPPEKGDPADPIDMTEVKAMIDAAVKLAVDALPKPKDGEDGKSIDPTDIKIMVADAVSLIPPAKDGESVSVEQVKAMVADQVSKIKLPEPKHGRDALDLEVMSTIDEKKSYPRGTYATHRGGMWKSFKQTEGMNGWECIVDGNYKTTVTQIDERNFCFITEKSSGSIVKLPFKVPSMIYKFVYVDGKEYNEGDTVTWAGSLWYCKEKTTDKPGDGSKAWHLSAKRGRDGNPKVKI